MSDAKPKQRIVVSAVNLTEGGPLSILTECLSYLSSDLASSYEVIVLVNNQRIFNYPNIRFYSFPLSKKSWFIRLYYEYIYFWVLSKKIRPHLWLSLHDTTPNVQADIRAVYCHNPSPFPPLTLKDIFLGGYKFILFKLFYRYLYAINIKKNDFVILQQDSLRDKFIQLTGAKKIIVAYPNIRSIEKPDPVLIKGNVFLYPSFPRVFKNFEVICRAAAELLKQKVEDFQVIFTISGSENRYARHIFNSFKHVRNIKFIGLQTRKKVFDLYNSATCLIFPSLLETWGLPITEAKLFSKPILLADLEYAHETVGAYDKVKFFSPEDYLQLAGLMKAVIDKTIVFDKTQERKILSLFSRGWKELFHILLSSNQIT
ncbi:MAG: glycosyltransferase [Candidatus Omnitrophica bacterium]|jgi:glycosyltransferase involved in cell wall biosynthesis|nr:glycosyltransferase [Candidatus Omnitrophota bacterium]